MTVYTFKAFHFVLYHHFSVNYSFFMAAGAGHPGVFSFEFESRFIVIKFRSFPVVEPVALNAICDAAFFKLPAMHVFVTGRAVGRHICKLLVSLGKFAYVVFFPVAGHARLIGMRAG